MVLIIKDIAIVAGLGLLYLMMVIVMIVFAIIARREETVMGVQLQRNTAVSLPRAMRAPCLVLCTLALS